MTHAHRKKTCLQYPQQFSGLSWLTGTNNLVSKNNFIENVEISGRGGFKKCIIQHLIFSTLLLFQSGWVGQDINSQKLLFFVCLHFSTAPKQGEAKEWGLGGNFTTANMKVTIQRHISTYVFTYYAPTGLFVVISWAAFVMSADKLQFRYCQHY